MSEYSNYKFSQNRIPAYQNHQKLKHLALVVQSSVNFAKTVSEINIVIKI